MTVVKVVTIRSLVRNVWNWRQLCNDSYSKAGRELLHDCRESCYDKIFSKECLELEAAL